MLKKSTETPPRNEHPVKSYGTPPLLSEKLISQLQGAVDDARRKQAPNGKKSAYPQDGLAQSERDIASP